MRTTRRPALSILVASALLAASLVLWAPAGQAQDGEESDDATLSGLDLDNATSGSSAPVDLGFEFTSDYEDYYASVLKEVTAVTVRPTATAGSAATIQVRLGSSGTPQEVASGSLSSALTILPNADLAVPHEIYVTVTAENGTDTKTYNISVLHFEPVGFGAATVDDMQLTAGTQADVPRLPAVTAPQYLSVSYTATGLPAGLSMGSDRVIRGTPEAATTTAATVTYTATAAEIGSSASLTFDVTVNPPNPPVTFDEAERLDVIGRSFAYTVGQATPFTFTFPEASGGTGTLTYYLAVDNQDPRSAISDHVTGLSFDPATRTLSAGAGAQEPSGDPAQCPRSRQSQRCLYGLSYWVEDERGATATITSNIAVSEAPSLPEIADQNLTVGDAVSITLPRATRGSVIASQPHPLDYTLGPELEDLSLDYGALALTGTADHTGSTEMTYTVTDRNGVSASRTFTLTVAAGPNAPASAPALTVSYTPGDSGPVLEWDDLEDATGYVVQVRAASDSFPSQAVTDIAGRSRSSAHQTRTADDGTVVAYRLIGGLTDGEYTARVAARNSDGEGPWSSEVTFTVRVGGL